MVDRGLEGCVVLTLICSSCATTVQKPAPAIQSYASGIAKIHSANPDVKIRLGHDAALPSELILFVDYPKPTADPAGRDIWCDAETLDWTTGTGISFQIKPASAERLSVSFFDRNHVVYTTWIDLEAGTWQPVRIAFANLRPNPYFQPPDAKTGAPLDLSEIKGLAFAPHHQTAGRLAISPFFLTK